MHEHGFEVHCDRTHLREETLLDEVLQLSEHLRDTSVQNQLRQGVHTHLLLLKLNPLHLGLVVLLR